MPRKTNDEFEKFDTTMRQLMKVPHSEIKAALDAEKEAKKKQKNLRKKKEKNDK